nr:hypothetical protein CFP56_76910 [Quercus suber]
MPSRRAQSSAMRIEVVLMCLENPRTQSPFKSQMRPPLPASSLITDASIFNLNLPIGGLIQLQLIQALNMDGVDGDIDGNVDRYGFMAKMLDASWID